MNVVHIRHQQTTYSQQYHRWTCLRKIHALSIKILPIYGERSRPIILFEKNGHQMIPSSLHPFNSSKHETVKNNTWLIHINNIVMPPYGNTQFHYRLRFDIHFNFFCLYQSGKLHTSKWHPKEKHQKHDLLMERDKRLNIIHFKKAYVTTLDIKEPWTFTLLVDHKVCENSMNSSALASLWNSTSG